jgi:pilus assembly protein TadC
MTAALRELARRLGNPIGGTMSRQLIAADELTTLIARAIEVFGEQAYEDAAERASLRLRLALGTVGLYGTSADVPLPITFRDELARELRALLREH